MPLPRHSGVRSLRNDGTVSRKESTLWIVGVGETLDGRGGLVQGSAGGPLRPATQP